LELIFVPYYKKRSSIKLLFFSLVELNENFFIVLHIKNNSISKQSQIVIDLFMMVKLANFH